MAIMIWQGATQADSAEWYPAEKNPPRRGDLIVMALLSTSPLPGPGWTRATGDRPYAWKYAYGDETGFPGPAVWYSGAVVADDE